MAPSECALLAKFSTGLSAGQKAFEHDQHQRLIAQSHQALTDAKRPQKNVVFQ